MSNIYRFLSFLRPWLRQAPKFQHLTFPSGIRLSSLGHPRPPSAVHCLGPCVCVLENAHLAGASRVSPSNSAGWHGQLCVPRKNAIWLVSLSTCFKDLLLRFLRGVSSAQFSLRGTSYALAVFPVPWLPQDTHISISLLGSRSTRGMDFSTCLLPTSTRNSLPPSSESGGHLGFFPVSPSHPSSHKAVHFPCFLPPAPSSPILFSRPHT